MDAAALAAENEVLQAELAERDAKIDVLTGKLEALALELARLKRQVIGPKSERRRDEDGPQASLFASPVASAPPEKPPATPPTPARAVTPHGRRRPEGPPDEVVAAKAPDACPSCGGALRTISTSTATRID